MRRGPALAENFLMTGGPPVKRLLIFFGSAFFRGFGSPGAGAGGCDMAVLLSLCWWFRHSGKRTGGLVTPATALSDARLVPPQRSLGDLTRTQRVGTSHAHGAS